MNKSYSKISDFKKSLRSSTSTSMKKSTKAKPVNQGLAKDHYIALSDAIIENPTCVEDNRISIVQKFVNQIDILPKKMQMVESLYLSNNNLRSINGIQQFKRLRNLSLANNEINDPNTVSYLQELPMLEVLNINGNPFCRIPNYKDYLVSSLPSLRSFDGKALTMEDRQRCEINIRAQNSMFEILTRNYCDLILMNSVVKRLDLHKEFLIKDPRYTWNFTSFSPSKLQQMYRLHELFDVHQRGALRADLMNDINVIKQELSLRHDQNDTAFTELIVRQEQKIAELMLLAEKKYKSMEELFNRNSAQLPHYQGRNEGVISVLSNRTSPRKSSRKGPKSKRFTVAGEHGSVESLGSSRSKVTFFTSNQPGSKMSQMPDNRTERDLFQKLYESSSPQQAAAQEQDRLHSSGFSLGSNAHTVTSARKVVQTDRGRVATGSFGPSEGPLRAEDLISRHSSSPQSHWMPASSKMETKPGKPHAEECCRKLYRDFESQIRSGMIDVTDNKPKKSFLKKSKSPIRNLNSPGSGNNKDKIIDELYRSLREKTQEVESLANANAELKEQVETSDRINPIHRMDSHQDIDTENVQAEFNEMKTRLIELAERNQELEQERRALHDTAERATEFAQELESITVEKQMMEAAEMFHDRQLLFKGFRYLCHSTSVSQKLNLYLKEKEYRQNAHRLRLIFRKWHQRSLLRKIVRQKQEVNNSRLVLAKFREWKYTINEVSRIKSRLMVKNEVLMNFCFLQWKRYLAYQYKTLHAKRKAHVFSSRKLMSKGFTGLRQLHGRCKYSANEERNLIGKYDSYYAFCTRRKLFSAWRAWIVQEHLPNKLNKQKAQAFRRIYLLRNTMDLILKHHDVALMIKDNAEKKITVKDNEILSNFFYVWRNGMRAYNRRKAELRNMQEKYILRRMTNKWKNAFERVRLQRDLLEGYDVYRELSLMKKVFRCLKEKRQARRKSAKIAMIVSLKNQERQMQSCFKFWLSATKLKRTEHEKVQSNEYDLLARTFKSWVLFSNTTKQQKQKREETEEQIKQQLSELKLKALRGWRAVTKKQLRNASVLAAANSRRSLRTYRKVLQCLVREVKQTQKKQVTLLSQKHSSLEKDVQETQEVLLEADNERTAFAEKESKYQEHIENLKRELEGKNNKIKEVQKELTSAELKSKNLEDKLEEQEITERSAKARSHSSIVETEKIAVEYENVVAELKRDKERLERQLKYATAQQKQEILVLTEEKQREEARLREKDSSEIAELRNKLRSSIKMANEFKLALENKDLQIERLLSSLEEYRRENMSLRAGLERSSRERTLSPEVVPSLKAAITDLGKKNQELKYDLKRMKEGDQKQKKEIKILISDIKDYEVVTHADDLLEQPAVIVTSRKLASPSEHSFTSHKGFESTAVTSRVISRSPVREYTTPARRFEEEEKPPISSREFNLKSEALKKKVDTLQQYLSEISTEVVDRTAINDTWLSSTRSAKPEGPLKDTHLYSARNSSMLSPRPPMDSLELSDSRSILKRSPRRTIKRYEKQLQSTLADVESPRVAENISTARNKYAREVHTNDLELSDIKLSRHAAKDTLEQRIKKLNDSLQDDINKARQRAAELST